MMKKNKFIITYLLSVFAFGLYAQYGASPSFYTPYYEETRPFDTRQIKQTACDITGTPNREKKYAIVGLNDHGSTYCERYATFGIKDGAVHDIVALSLEEFSWDHSGITKVLFDPRDSDVFYVLYQESVMHPIAFPGGARSTYLKRFEYNGTDVLTESPRLEIFNYANGADFVITPKGRILVCAVNDFGQIRGKRVQDMLIVGSEQTFSDIGEAKVGTFLQSISMDIKGNKVVLGHTTGSLTSTKMRLLRINFFLGIPLIISERFGDGHRMRVDTNTPKTVAIRKNGDAFYLNWNDHIMEPWTYDLVKFAEGSETPSYVFTEAPSAEDLVISEDNNIYVSGVVDGEYAIGLFNQYDAFEHLYDVHSDLDNPLHDIAVVDCSILASGHRFIGGHHRPSHQTFSCTECDGGNPYADFEFTNSTGGTYGPTYYGMKYIPGYCDKYEIIVDGSASSCENSYWLSLQQIDPSTWTLLGSPIISWLGFSGEVPHDIALADYLPGVFSFDPAATYLLTLTVGLDGGGPFHSEHKLFRVNPIYCNSSSRDIAQPSISSRNVKIFPNPSTGMFQVENSNTLDETTYIVNDIKGRVILETTGKGSIPINLEGNPSGIYFIHIFNSERQIVEKLILK